MNMFEAVKSVLSKYVKFTGRAQRAEFWYWCLALVIISFIISVLSEFVNVDVISLVFILVIILPGFAVSVRRLHDTGRTGWWLAWFYIGFISIFLIAGLVSASMMVGGKEPSSLALMFYGFFNIALMIGILVYCVLLIVFFCQDSQAGPNKYGSNPKNEGNFDIFS